MSDATSPFPALSRRGVVIGAAGLLAGCQDSGGPLPQVTLPPISGLTTTSGWKVPAVDTRLFAGRVTVLNVWASWCPYCRGEHDHLKSLASLSRAPLVGLVHQDTAEKARDYLQKAGNPYSAVSVDENGELARALGQRGVPHTYVIGRDLKVITKVRGALSQEVIERMVLPAIAKGFASA